MLIATTARCFSAISLLSIAGCADFSEPPPEGPSTPPAEESESVPAFESERPVSGAEGGDCFETGDCPWELSECEATAPDQVTSAPSATSGPWSAESALVIDLNECQTLHHSVWLPLGSAWVTVAPDEAGTCSVWLGGETENPMYDGSTVQQCRFQRKEGCVLSLGPAEHGGPLLVDSTACLSDFD